MTADLVLELSQIECHRGGLSIVAVDSMQVPARTVTALVGLSGSGKTTLLSAIAGTLTPTRGVIRIDGSVCDESTRMRLTARTLQNFPLLHWKTVRENLILSSRIRGRDVANPVAILQRFRAEHLADRYPRTLSGGERCRASLAQAVVTNPRVLLLDEPFTGLDTVVKRDVAQTLFTFARAEGAAVVFVTHDLDDASHYADRIAVLIGRAPSHVGGEMNTQSSNATEQVFELLQKADSRE